MSAAAQRGEPDGLVVHLIEPLRGLGRDEAQRMSGGHGVYCDGLFIAIVLDSVLYFKADEASGAPGLHFYTLNQAGLTSTIWQRLGL